MFSLGKNAAGLLALSAFVVVASTQNQGAQVPFGYNDSEHIQLEEAHRIITDELSEFAEKVVAEKGIRGLSLGVVRPDGEVEFGAWGNSTEEGDAVDADTLFHIGSCTKAFLAASLGILIDDFDNGRNVTPLPYPLATFGWHTKIKDLLPDDWKLADEWAEEKTDLRDILSHVSGLAGHDLSYKPNDSMKDVVRRLRYHNTPFELRQTFAYNNEMFVTGSYILSTYSGVSFGDFLRERIFKPLGMNSTYTSPSEAAASGKFSQAWAATGRRIPFWFSEESQKTISGAGSIFTSARDMTKWLQTLINEGVDPVSNSTVIPKEVFKQVTTASVIVPGSGASETMSIVGYGHGWARFSYHGHEVIYHTGGLPGFLSLVDFLPHAKLGIVSLTNTDGGNEANSILGNRIVEDALNLSHSIPFISEDVNMKSDSMLNSADNISAAPLSLPLKSYAGTYYRPDYGNITLCTSSKAKSPKEGGDTSSNYCASLRSSFAIVDNATSEQTSQLQLLAAYESVWVKQLRLTHIHADVFALTGTTLFTEGFGANKHPFEYRQVVGATARFIIGKEGSGKDSSMPQVKGFWACEILRDTDEVQGDCETGKGARPGSLVWFERLS